MDENYIILVQRHFRIKKIEKAIKILKFDKKVVENNTFEEFIDLIVDKKVLSLTNYILTKITRVSNFGEKNILTPNNFLSAFVICGYPNDVLEGETSTPLIKRVTSSRNLNNLAIKKAKQVVQSFDTFLYTKLTKFQIDKFSKLLTDYKDIFDAWKLNDYEQFIHKLTVSYYEVESMIQEILSEGEGETPSPPTNETTVPPSNEVSHSMGGEGVPPSNEVPHSMGGEGVSPSTIMAMCLERQDDIINKIIYLNGQEYFNNYKHEEITLDESVQKQIKDTLHAAFWDLFKSELDSSPPVHDRLFQLLEELRDTFCNFVPNRKDIQEEIYENIDVKLIKNMIENNAFDDDNLYKLSTYIISLIKKFQPPVMDEDIDNWEQGMLEQFKEKFEYSEFLITFFQSVFNMLESIIIYAKKASEDLSEMESHTQM